MGEIMIIVYTTACYVGISSSPFGTLHVIPPRMLSVIRDQGPCDLWGMSSSRDWRLLTNGSTGITDLAS